MKGKLISKNFIPAPKYVYDIEVKDTHTYFANGINVHNCKSKSSQQGENLLKLKDFKYKVAATGTLLMNNPLDAYVPLVWLDKESSNLSTFKRQYCSFGGVMGKEIVGYKNLDILKDVIDSCSLRRTKDLLNLPEKLIIDEFVEMSPSHRDFYNSVKNGVKSECDKIELNSSNVLALTTRLRQATSCPSILTSNEEIKSSKLERCVELVEEIVSHGDKVVIMSSFKEPLYQLNSILKEYSPLLGIGDLSDDEVSNNIDNFQNDDKYKVFLGTYSKVSTGVTLNSARYMICLDEKFTAAENLQAQDRIHRVNNKHSVFIYNLICEKSFDEHVHEIAQIKKDLSDYVIDNRDVTSRLREYLLDL